MGAHELRERPDLTQRAEVLEPRGEDREAAVADEDGHPRDRHREASGSLLCLHRRRALQQREQLHAQLQIAGLDAQHQPAQRDDVAPAAQAVLVRLQQLTRFSSQLRVQTLIMIYL